jgi:hypothetical protein
MGVCDETAHPTTEIEPTSMRVERAKPVYHFEYSPPLIESDRPVDIAEFISVVDQRVCPLPIIILFVVKAIKVLPRVGNEHEVTFSTSA